MSFSGIALFAFHMGLLFQTVTYSGVTTNVRIATCGEQIAMPDGTIWTVEQYIKIFMPTAHCDWKKP